MKIRKILYGYKYENGIIVIEKKEKENLLWIFNSYLAGMSLLNISKSLNEQNIEYMPNYSGWNKARIMRFIEDIRYVGNETYPSIITMEMHNELINLKMEKNTQKDTDRTVDIYKLNVPVLCPICGHKMQRRHLEKTKYKDKWTCRNSDCGKEIYILDDILLHSITRIMNRIIINPQIIKNEINDSEVNMNIIKMENEINHKLDSNKFDKDELRGMMLECTNLKYQALGSNAAVTKKLKADFEKATPLKTFSLDFFNKTVNEVVLNENSSIDIILINGQKIGEMQ